MCKIKIENENVVFSRLILNQQEELELAEANVDFLSNHRFVFNEEKETLETISNFSISMVIELEKEEIKELKNIKRQARASINSFYKGLLDGSEEFLLLNTKAKEFPYIITSQAILDAEVSSPKYENAMEYVFSDKILKMKNKKRDFEFTNHEEFQRELGQKVKKKKLESDYNFKGQRALKLKWDELVS